MKIGSEGKNAEQCLMQLLLSIHHGSITSAALGLHLMLAPRAFDCHRNGASKDAVLGCQYSFRVNHGLVEFAWHIVIIFAGAAFDKDLGNGTATFINWRSGVLGLL